MLENKEIVEKIRTICRDKDTSITKLEESLGWSNGYIGKWAKAKKRPSIEKLSVVAECLNVPISDLTGEIDIKNPASETGDGSEAELIQLFRLLPDDLKAGMLAQIKAVLAQRGLLPGKQEPLGRGPGTD